MRFLRYLTLPLALAAAVSCDGGGTDPVRQPATITRIAGEGQTATVGSTLPANLSVRVSDAEGNAVAGSAVSFVVTPGSGAVGSTLVTTTSEGVAQTTWTLGTAAGPQQLEARVTNGETGQTLTTTFSATARAGAPATLQKTGGDAQTGAGGSVLPTQLAVRVVDQFGNPVPGVAVTFTPAAGSGAVNPTSAVTGTDGVARTTWTLGGGAGTSQTVTAGVTGVAPVSFTASTTPAGPATQLQKVSGDLQEGTAGTALPAQLGVRAVDASGNPVSGVTVTFAVTQGGGSVSPTTAVTGADGIARSTWTLGATAGSSQTATASVAGLPTVTFTASAKAGAFAKLRIVPDSAVLNYIGGRVTLKATGTDASGNLSNADVWSTWQALDPAIVSQSPGTGSTDGGFTTVATANAVGTGRIVAIGPFGTADTVLVRVQQIPGSITAPSVIYVAQGSTATIEPITVKDSSGHPIVPTPALTFTSAAPTVATVDAAGRVTGVAVGNSTVTIRSAANTATSVSVQVVAAETGTMVSAGGAHYCFLQASSSIPRCIGNFLLGQLGNGTGNTNASDITRPVAFSTVSAAMGHSCGVSSGDIWCWGVAQSGQMGTGIAPGLANCRVADGMAIRCERDPVMTLRSATWSSVSAGGHHTCALSTTGIAYCWGRDDSSQVGTASSSDACNPGPEEASGSVPCHYGPSLVAGGLTFTAITTGQSHSCGLTAAGEAWCWGANGAGQLGDGTTTTRATPVRAAPGLTFSSLAAGGSTTCGVTAAGQGYCWGRGDAGQLGNGAMTSSATPVLVASPKALATIDPGFLHSCGVATDGTGYCWGENGAGELGTGSTTDSAVPVAVIGGFSFRAISASERPPTFDGSAVNPDTIFSCGVTTSNVIVCWGNTHPTPTVQPATQSQRQTPL